MSLVEKIRGAIDLDEQHRPYACLHCDSRFVVQYQVCPECGGYAIERLDWTEHISCE